MEDKQNLKDVEIERKTEDNLIVKFGDVEVSINKNKSLRDIAVMVDDIVGVTFWDTDNKKSMGQVDGFGLKALNDDSEKLKKIREGFSLLKYGG